MKIAIDLNDVLRDFTKHFSELYRRNVNTEIDIDTIDYKVNDLKKVFPFNNEDEYLSFLYEDFAFEIFGCSPTPTKELATEFNQWLIHTVGDLDTNETIDLMIVSPMEYGISIQSTFFFLSRIGCRVREVYLPMDSLTIWDKCDVLITANPKLLENKPNGKISIKIKAPYNSNCKGDYEYDNMSSFCKDENILNNLIEKKIINDNDNV